MYTRILAAVDGSAASDLALRQAIQLAREQGAALRIVHVLHDDPYWYISHFGDGEYIDMEGVEQAWRDAAQHVLDAAVEAARQQGVEPQAALLNAAGAHIAAAIVKEAQTWGADVIVMGTHGRHGVEHLLLGSVAEMVARTAPAPLLLLRGA